MTTAAERRKHAEKIQKDALQARLDAVQPLIDEVSKRETLMEKVAAMQIEINNLDATIATHYRAALDGGWTTNELASANLNVLKTVTRKRGTTPPRNSAAVPDPLPEDDGQAGQRTPRMV